jgi:3-hydroxybutyryl-CoA dehydratase
MEQPAQPMRGRSAVKPPPEQMARHGRRQRRNASIYTDLSAAASDVSAIPMEASPHTHLPVVVGASAALTKTIRTEDLRLFAEVSLDTNPVHFNEAFAATTRFGGIIAHGMIPAGLISAVIGTRLPGPGTIYLGQTLQFKRPVRVGDTLTATVEVAEVREDKAIATLTTTVRNQQDEVVVSGEAKVLFADVKPAVPVEV